ncbi:MAG TPA: transcription termination factor Rho [Acidimicrobiales bacterium]
MSVEPSTLERSALERKDREELTTIATALGVKPPSRARKAEIVQLILELTGVEPAADRAAGATEGEAPVAQAANGRSKEAVVEDDADTTAGAPGAPATAGGEGDARTTGDEQAGERAEAGAGPAAGDRPSPTDSEPPSEWELEFGGTTDVPHPPPVQEAPARGPGATAERGGRNGGRGEAPAAGRQRGGSPGQPQPTGARPSGATGQAAGSGEGDRREGGQPGQGDGGQQANGGQQGGEARQGGDHGRHEGPDAGEAGNRRRRRRGRRGKDEQGPSDEFTGEPVEVEGLLDLRDEGYGFLRVRGYLPSKDDIYVSVKQVRQFGLRRGDRVKGASRPAMRNEKNPALLRIDDVNGVDPEQARNRRRFEDLTPLFPDQKLVLETTDDPGNMTARIVDLISPVGKGQRGLIVSPPKAGKTAIVKQVARSIETNNPEVKLLVLLVDERPEEVTDMRRWLRSPSSEVVASTFDRPAEEHCQVAELTIERAKRMVEDGKDVCIILDGITRLARAYNLAAPATGRIMSGGVDSGALYPPKKFFGAARNIEEGGSLTILATALIETGSKMDEVIFEEFKGTGNMELRLDRRLAERRIYPAIDVGASSTRHEELLFARNQLNLVWALRRVLTGLSSTDGGNAAALELLMDRMKTFRTNDEFLTEVAKNRLAAG